MLIFTTLLIKLLPLYGIVLLGYIAGKKLEVQKESVAQLLIYIVSPVVVFSGVIATELNASILSLPILFFILCCSLCLLFYSVGKLFWTGSEKNILSFTAGHGNTGYFGLPVLFVLLGDQFLGLAVMMILGFSLYDSTLGFYMVAKGHHTAKESLKKLLHLPTLYAFFLGIIINYLNISLHPILLDALHNFQGMFVVLGMMLIGLGLSEVTRASLDYKFTAIAFLAKFVVWPGVMGLIIFLDKTYFHFYNSSTYKIMLLMSIVPLAVNTVAYATKLNTHPEKVSLTVLLSTIFALFYIPLFVVLFFGLV